MGSMMLEMTFQTIWIMSWKGLSLSVTWQARTLRRPVAKMRCSAELDEVIGWTEANCAWSVGMKGAMLGSAGLHGASEV